MEASGSKEDLSSEQEEPLDAVEPTQADLGLESDVVQAQRDVGEESILAASEVTPQLIQAGSALESCGFLEVELGITQGYRGVSAQPTQAGLGLESHSSQEQPNLEEVAFQADSGVAIQLTQAGSRLESRNFQERANVEEGAIHGVVVQPMQADLGLDFQNLQEEQLSFEEREPNVAQPNQADPFNSVYIEPVSIERLYAQLHTCVDDEERVFIEVLIELVTRQGEPSHQGGEAGINDRNVRQGPPFDVNNLRNGHAENSHPEEEAGINGRNGINGINVDMDYFRSDGPIEPMDNEEPMDDEEEIDIQARQAGQQQMQDGPPQQGTAGRRMRLQVPLCGAEGRSEPKCVSIASSERTCMCGGIPLEQEAEKGGGDMIGPLRKEGLIACATKSADNLDGSQKNFQDVSESSTLALIFVCLFGNFCRLTRMAFTHV